MKLVLHASELAGCAGMQKYKKIHVCFEKVWLRHSPLTYQAACANQKKKGKADQLQDALTLVGKESQTIVSETRVIDHNENMSHAQASKSSMDAVMRLNQISDKRISEINNKRGELQKVISQAHDNGQPLVNVDNEVIPVSIAVERADRLQHDADKVTEGRRMIAEEVTQTINTSFGTAKEAEAVTRFVANHGFNVHVAPDQTFFKAVSENLFIAGRVDGLIGDDKVLEVKNRMNRLFGSVPEYERVQCMSYMWLSGRPYCVWLQALNKGASDMQQDHKTLHFDEDLWDQICSRLIAFADCVWRHEESTETADDYQRCKDGEKDHYLLSFMGLC